MLLGCFRIWQRNAKVKSHGVDKVGNAFGMNPCEEKVFEG